MKILFLGDSITAGAGLACQEDSFPSVIGKKLNCEVKNYGVGGTRIARQKIPFETTDFDEDFLMRAEKMDKQADKVFVFGGTNDFGHGDAPIGVLSDGTPYTFCGALNCLIDRLEETYGRKNVTFILPLHRKDEQNKRGENGCKAEDVGTLDEYVDVEKNVLEKRNVAYFDVRESIPFSELQNLTIDGIHPTKAGHQRLAEAILRNIESQNINEKAERLV